MSEGPLAIVSGCEPEGALGMGSRFSVSAGSGLVWMRLPRRASSSSPRGEGPGQKRGQTILPSNALIWGASQGVRARSGSAYRTWGACASHLVRREPWGSPGRAGAWSDSGFKTSGCLLGVDGDTWGHGGGSMEGERPVGRSLVVSATNFFCSCL